MGQRLKEQEDEILAKLKTIGQKDEQLKQKDKKIDSLED